MNHRFPSGPAAIASGWLTGVGIENSANVPARVIRPILLAPCSANQRFPSGPAAMEAGWLAGVGIGNSVIFAVGAAAAPCASAVAAAANAPAAAAIASRFLTPASPPVACQETRFAGRSPAFKHTPLTDWKRPY